MAIDEGNIVMAITGNCSLTLLLSKWVAEALGIHNGEILKFDVSCNRLIVEKMRDEQR